MFQRYCSYWASAVVMALAFLAFPLVTASAQAPAERPAPQAAKYQVIPYSHNSAIMVDLTTGQSWKLERNAEQKASFVWVPIRTLSTNMEVDEWKQRMEKFRNERRKRREGEFREEAPWEKRPHFDIVPVPTPPDAPADFDLEP